MKTIKRLKIALFLAACLAISIVQAQETMDVDRFDEIIVTGIIDVVLEQGEKEQVILFNDSDIDKDDIKVKTSQGVLKITVLKSLIKDHDEIKLKVIYNKLLSIKASAGAEIIANNTIKGQHLHLKAHSGAEIELDLDVSDLEASAFEGAQMRLDGQCDTQKVSAASGGEYHAYDLQSNHAYVKANTGGLVKVYASESIEASANTGGRIKYKGNPAKVKEKDYLGGEVDEM